MESRRGVEHDRVPRGMRLSLENGSHGPRVGFDLPSSQGRQARLRKAEVIGGHDELTHLPILVELGDARGRGRAQLVEAVFAAHDPRPRHAEAPQSLPDKGAEAVLVDPNELMRRVRRIRKRTQDVEYGSRAELAACDGRVPKSRMVGLRKQKSDSRLTKDVTLPVRGDIQGYAHSFEDVGASASARSRSVAVFRHRHATGGHHDCRRAGEIQSLRAVPAGAARVHDERQPVADGRHRPAHRFYGGRDDFRGLSCNSERHREGSHLHGRPLARKDGPKCRPDLDRRQGAMANQLAYDEGKLAAQDGPPRSQ